VPKEESDKFAFCDQLLGDFLKSSHRRRRMADLSAEELKTKVFEVLKGVDLASTSAKKVRLQLEEDLKTNLSGRKEELGKIIQVC